MINKLSASISIAWLSFLLAPVAMLIGHLGAHDLDWTSNQISTFAARAPHGNWITCSMLLTVLGLLFISLALSESHVFNKGPVKQIIPMLTGAAAAGLLTLAAYQETATSARLLRNMSFDAIRQQSFHDAGLMIFYYGSILLLVISGLWVMVRQKDPIGRMMGVLVAGSGPFSFLAMTSSWPGHFGFSGAVPGIKQRMAFLCLWLGVLILLTFMTKSLRNKRAAK